MGGPYCKDCAFWYRRIRSEDGECMDHSKIIYRKYGDAVNGPPVTDPTDTCGNWTDKPITSPTPKPVSDPRTEPPGG